MIRAAQKGSGLVAKSVFGVLGFWPVLWLLDLPFSPAVRIPTHFQGFGLKMLGQFQAIRNIWKIGLLSMCLLELLQLWGMKCECAPPVLELLCSY